MPSWTHNKFKVMKEAAWLKGALKAGLIKARCWHLKEEAIDFVLQKWLWQTLDFSPSWVCYVRGGWGHACYQISWGPSVTCTFSNKNVPTAGGQEEGRDHSLFKRAPLLLAFIPFAACIVLLLWLVSEVQDGMNEGKTDPWKRVQNPAPPSGMGVFQIRQTRILANMYYCEFIVVHVQFMNL